MARGRPTVEMHSGDRYGRLVLVDRCDCPHGTGARTWICSCSCGNQTKATQSNLTNGKVKSCGCGQGKWKYKGSEASFAVLILRYKKDAKKRGIPWEIDRHDLLELMQQPCYYCGCSPYRITPKHGSRPDRYIRERYNGVDRTDSSAGYSLGNLVACCAECNVAKRDMSVDEFKEWLIDVFRHMKSKGEIE